jgi:glucose-1-phosphate cytidylyltransferase
MGEEDLWLNGGYFIFRHDIFDYIEPGDKLVEGPLSRLTKERQLHAHRFSGFWSPMDTFKEQNYLEGLYNGAEAPWALWRNGGGE